MLRFIDGFDHVALANIPQKWSNTNLTQVFLQTPGRFGGAYLHFHQGNSFIQKTLDNQPTWVVGFALRIATGYIVTTPLFQILDAGTLQVDLRIGQDNTLYVTRNGTAVTGGNTTYALTPTIWHYVEFKVTISSSIAANSWQVKVDGGTVINVAAGQSSKNTANATANQIKFGPIFQNNDPDYDDIYICDGQGTANNDFLGDAKVVMMLPTAAGTMSQWTPLSGANYTNVNQAQPDDDASYVYTSTPGQMDTYLVGDITDNPANIFGVQTNLYIRKDDAGLRSVSKVIRSGGTNYTGTAVDNLAAGYGFYTEVDEKDPGTGVAWTKAGFNAAEFGATVIA